MGLTAQPPELPTEIGELERRVRDLETAGVLRSAAGGGQGPVLNRILAWRESGANQAIAAGATNALTGLRHDLELTEPRRVKLVVEATVYKNAGDAAGQCHIGIRYNGVTGSTLLLRQQFVTAGMSAQVIHAERILVLGEGTHRIMGFISSTAGNLFTWTTTPNQMTFMAVEDCGPPDEFPPPPSDVVVPPPPPPPAPPPQPPPVTTTRVAEWALAAGTYSGSTWLNWIAGVPGFFNIPRNGSLHFWGHVDCRMLFWVNNEGIGLGTRFLRTEIPGFGASGNWRMGEGIGNVHVTRDDWCAITAGVRNAGWWATLAGGNQLQVFGGALYADFVG